MTSIFIITEVKLENDTDLDDYDISGRIDELNIRRNEYSIIVNCHRTFIDRLGVHLVSETDRNIFYNGKER